MRINIPEIYDRIEVEENEICVLVIEDQIVFRNVVSEVIKNVVGDLDSIAIFEGMMCINRSKVDIVYNYFDLTVNSKKNISKLHHNIANTSVSEKWYLKTQQLQSVMIQYLIDISFDIENQVSFNEEFSFANFLKMFDVKFAEEQVSFLEKIIVYLQVSQEITDLQIVFFVSLKQYLNNEELLELYKFANYAKIAIVLLEQQECDKIEAEKHFILDKDLCLIYK